MKSDKPNLENLARAQQLNAEPAAAEQIGRLLASAEAQLRDSRNPSLSAPSRFMLAYNAAHALARARKQSVTKLFDEMATVLIAEYDAETRFRARAVRGAGKVKRGLRLLEKAAGGK